VQSSIQGGNELFDLFEDFSRNRHISSNQASRWLHDSLIFIHEAKVTFTPELGLGPSHVQQMFVFISFLNLFLLHFFCPCEQTSFKLNLNTELMWNSSAGGTCEIGPPFTYIQDSESG
jgi:hypothetical protein